MPSSVAPTQRHGRPFSDRQLEQILTLLSRENDFVFLESGRITPEDQRSLLFLRPLKLLTLTAAGDINTFFQAIEDELNQGRYLAGWFAYELGYRLEPHLGALLPVQPRPLAVLGVYRQPLIYQHQQQAWQKNRAFADFGSLLASEVEDQPEPKPPIADNRHLNLSREQYRERIRQIKQYIAAGDTYQVNFTIKQEMPYSGSAAALYRSLRRNQRVSYAGWLGLAGEHILSFSPELFFRCREGHCTVRPMKGTTHRGLTPTEDAARAEFLTQDPKNRSENVMIVDLLRNDLGRICRPGSVRVSELFKVESYETLHQMTSTIQGELRPATGVAEIFRALFPCGSVTGAPKIRTMEIIRQLEAGPRGVYTGAIGFLSPEREMVFSVPIRTVQLAEQKISLGIGSGIVSDSEPEQEWRECLLKGNFLSRPLPPFVLIETMLWQPGCGYRLEALHRQRLQESAAALGFHLELAELQQLLSSEAARFKTAQRVRLTLAKDGTLTLTNSPFTATPCFSWAEADKTGPELPPVIISPQPVEPNQPLLYHKTSLRDFYDEERRQAISAGYHEVLFVNTRGELSEGAITNLFIRQAGKLLTPPLQAGLLNGVLRRHLLAQKEFLLTEQTLYPPDLAEAEAIYLGNSLRGLQRVRLAQAPAGAGQK